MKKRNPLIRVAVLFAIGVLVYILGRSLGWIDPVPKLQWNGEKVVNGLLLLLGLLIIEGVVSFILDRLKPRSNRAKTLIALSRNIMHYAVILLTICILLTMLNVDIVTILSGLGIIALIIGFGAESLIADVVTGMFILMDNQYNIGDIIEINGFRGTVTDVSVRTTVLTDVGGNVKIINNSDMKNILNRSDNTSRSVAEFGIPYDTDLETLEKEIPALLQSIYNAHTDLMKDVPVYVGVDQLGDSAVILKFVVEVAEKDIYTGARVLNHDLFIGMRKLGVEVPFPQVDVHQK